MFVDYSGQRFIFSVRIALSAFSKVVVDNTGC